MNPGACILDAFGQLFSIENQKSKIKNGMAAEYSVNFL